MKHYKGRHEKDDDDIKISYGKKEDIAFNAEYVDYTLDKNNMDKTSVYSLFSEKSANPVRDASQDTIKIDLPIAAAAAATPEKKRKLTKKELVMRILKISGLCLAGLLLLGIIGFGVFTYQAATYSEPKIDEAFNNIKLDYTTLIYANDPKTGKPVEIERLYLKQNRLWVDYDKIPQYMKDAVVAIEDKRFFEHNGVDWKRFTKAFINYFIPFSKNAGGGSTLTQQLIKNLTLDKKKTAFRKYQEVLRSLYVERKYNKDQILEYYLNDVYFGKSCYGVQTAANYYFGKDVGDLTLAECASIAAITNSPAKYDPYINLKNNQTRQKNILHAMLEQKKITQAQYDEAIKQELVLVKKEVKKTSKQSYFVDALIEDVIADLKAQCKYTSEEAEKVVYTQGLRIYATVDTQVQGVMDSVFSDPANFPKGTLKTATPQCAMIIIDPKTGAVLGIAGGIGEKSGDRVFNRATQTERQPGSSIKPVAVYGPAIENGVITLGSIYEDKPLAIGTGSDVYKPKNAYSGYLGKITMKTAVEQSTNTVAVQILQNLGVENSFNFLTQKVHITTLVDKRVQGKKTFTDKTLPLALGGLTDGVTVEQLTAAYTIFANKGIYTSPHTYTKVEEEDGTVLLTMHPQTTIAVSEETAYLTQTLLQSAVEKGTATTAKLGYIPVAGKTGTTSDNKDKWFIGYTPYYLGGAWFGYDEPTELSKYGISSNPAAKAWKLVMDKLHKEKKLTSGSLNGAPSDIIQAQFCLDTGLKPTSGCKRIGTENFVKGTEPTQECTLHGGAAVVSTAPSSSAASSSMISSSSASSSTSSSKSSSSSKSGSGSSENTMP